VQGYCDTLTEGGGWLVIQRKRDDSQDFNQFWCWDLAASMAHSGLDCWVMGTTKLTINFLMEQMVINFIIRKL